MWYNMPENADGLKRESESIMKKVSVLLTVVAFLLCMTACNSHEHRFGEWFTTKNATCTEDGVKTRYCSCGEKQTDVIPAKEHKYIDYECIGCGDIKECKHKNFVILPAKDSTCIATGLTEGKKCSDCGEILIAQQEVPLKDHTEVIDKTVPATCTQTGLTEGKHCSKCDTVFVQQNAIPIINHSYQSTYKFDNSFHWLECKNCNSIKDKKEHTLNDANFCTVCDQPMGPTEGIIYEKSADGTHAEVVTYTGSATKIRIADTYEGVPVTIICDNAFENCKAVTSVIIPDSVTSIASRAFYNCNSLTSVVIPDRVTSIGAYAFLNCDSLTSVVIPDRVTSIGSRAFYDCQSLEFITIGKGVTSIDNDAFMYCRSLISIEVDNDNEHYKSIDGNLYTKDGKTLVQYAIGKTDTNFVIPNSVTTIAAYAFSYSKLESIVIPNSVTSIASWAFFDSNLASVVIPNGVTSIASCAFSHCSYLTSIEIPDSVINIESGAFNDCEKIQFNEYEYGKYLGNEDNPYFALIELTTSKLSGYTIHSDTKVIADNTFANCDRLRSIVIPEGVTSISSYAFYKCSSLTSVIIGDGVASIGDYAFCYCTALTSVVIGDGVASIDDYAFYGCSSLTSVVIGEGVASIGYAAFSSCSALKDVYYTGSEEEWKAITIDSYNSPLKNATIHYNYILKY